MVQTTDEPPVEAWRTALAGYQRSRLPPLTAGQLSLTAALSAKSERAQHDSGISQISDLRRSARRWLNLPPLVEARGQLAERTIELTQNARRSAEAGARHNAARRNHSDLAREHAQLEQLLSPLDAALQSLETIEGLLLTALDETPPDLLPEATASFTRFKEQLVSALLRLTHEDSLAFALHELDEHPTLPAVLLPLLRFCQQQRWECTLHFDHQKRTPESGWPSLQDRRWGPPTRNEDYLLEPAEKPSGAVLIRVRGAGAGALLSFYMGRLRFSQSGGQLLIRPLAHRYELKDEDWAHRRFSASIDRQVAQREALLFDIDAIAQTITPKGDPAQQLEPAQLFERWSSVLFERIVTKAASEEPFSAALE
jgi:hypothetical protein